MGTYQFSDLQFIAGEWVQGRSARVLKDIDPYHQSTILNLHAAGKHDVDKAYLEAENAFHSWSNTDAKTRKQLVERVADIIQNRRTEIVELLIHESGSTRLKANIEVDAALGIIKEAATFPNRILDSKLKSLDPDRHSWVYKKALGVIGVISPWNFPFHLSMRSVVTAIAIGNTVVLKPASETPLTGGLLLAKIFEEANLPKGVLSVVAGSGSEIGDYFVEHSIPKLISFTGSTQVGQRVGELAVAGQYIKRLALELGGNAPLVILDDADLDLAVELTVMGRFLHQGQICMSTNRVIVDTKIYDQYIEKLIAKVKTLKTGDPSLEETLIGPIINSTQVEKIQDIIFKAKQQGAKLAVEGEIKNNLISPFVFIDVDPESDLAQQESFGPVLPVIKAEDEAHALKLANNTQFGLSSAVCTKDKERGLKFALAIDAGMTHINAISVADDPIAPFGGEKNSGLGRFNGHWILEEFTKTHWITVNK